MSLESITKARICGELRDIGALIHVIPGVAESSGYPDRFIVHKRWSGYIEFKTSRGSLRENQRLNLKEISRRFFPAIVLKGDTILEIMVVGGASGKLQHTGLQVTTGVQLLTMLERLSAGKAWELYAGL